MRKLIAGLFSTLDGVVESPEKWSMPYMDAEAGQALAQVFSESDTALMGRKTYQEWSAFFPYASTDQVPQADWMNNTPKYVVSSSLTTADWNNSHIISGDVEKQIAALKEQPGKNINVGGSVTLVHWLLDRGLLDELYLHIVPVILGAGERLLEDVGDPDLEPIKVVASPAVTHIKYRIGKSGPP